MNSQRSKQHIPAWLFPAISLIFYLFSPASGIASPEENSAETSSLHYRSAFTHYQKFSDQPTLSWREANDTVDKIGGWRFYAKEATLPDTADESGNHKTHPQAIESVKPSNSISPHSGNEARP